MNKWKILEEGGGNMEITFCHAYIPHLYSGLKFINGKWKKQYTLKSIMHYIFILMKYNIFYIRQCFVGYMWKSKMTIKNSNLECDIEFIELENYKNKK